MSSKRKLTAEEARMIILRGMSFLTEAVTCFNVLGDYIIDMANETAAKSKFVKLPEKKAIVDKIPSPKKSDKKAAPVKAAKVTKEKTKKAMPKCCSIKHAPVKKVEVKKPMAKKASK